MSKSIDTDITCKFADKCTVSIINSLGYAYNKVGSMFQCLFDIFNESVLNADSGR